MRKRAALREPRAKQIDRGFDAQIRVALFGEESAFLFAREHAAELAGAIEIAQRAPVAHVDHADGQPLGRERIGERLRLAPRLRHILRRDAEQTAALEAGQRGGTVVDEHGNDGHGRRLLC